jgi:GTPase
MNEEGNSHCMFALLVETTREHFACAMALGMPVFVVINKIDLCSKATIQQTINCLTYLLKQAHPNIQIEPFLVQKHEDLVVAAEFFIEKKSNTLDSFD